MKHQQYREWLPLFLYEELNEQQQNELLEHLNQCEDCSFELRQLERLHHKLDQHPAFQPSEQLLSAARSHLRVALRMERNKTSWKDHLFQTVHGVMPYTKVAIGFAATFVFGLLAGLLFFQRAPIVIHEKVSQRAASDAPLQPIRSPLLSEDVRIANVKFEDADASDGVVSFTFENVVPMRLEGRLDDERVQKVLTYAMVNAQNPGIRLRAVNAVSDDPLKMTDQDVKSALITALTSDENPGVRKEAFTALQKFPVDQQIKKALLHVLVHDDNPGMRVAAIKNLEAGHLMDSEVLTVLREKSRSDEVGYIRVKATNLLQEATERK